MDQRETKKTAEATEYPAELIKRAREFFSKAAKTAYSLNYDYAIELYLDGLSFWPEALDEGHKPLRDVALRRSAAGGKKSGFGDNSKYRKLSTKNPRDSFLKAEYFSSKDPANLSLLADVVKAAIACGFRQTTYWFADVLLDANMKQSKPDFKIYILLRDVYSQIEYYQRAVQSCQLALQIKPKDTDLANILRDLSARATLQHGKYEEEGDFRDSIRDVDEQKKLQEDEQLVRTENMLERAIREARQAYKQDPKRAANIDKLVKALCDTEEEKNEDEAIAILMQVWKDNDHFAYRQQAGEVRLRQLRRRVRHLKEKAQANPKDQVIRKKLQNASKKALLAELEHYKACVDNYPTDRRLKCEYGMRLMRARKYDDAIPFFQEARSDPRNRLLALNSIGQCFYHKQWYPDAVESFQQAFEQVENKEGALAKELLYNLGRAYEADDNLQEALGCFRKVTQLDFNYSDAKNRVDSLRKKQKESNKATE